MKIYKWCFTSIIESNYLRIALCKTIESKHYLCNQRYYIYKNVCIALYASNLHLRLFYLLIVIAISAHVLEYHIVIFIISTTDSIHHFNIEKINFNRWKRFLSNYCEHPSGIFRQIAYLNANEDHRNLAEGEVRSWFGHTPQLQDCFFLNFLGHRVMPCYIIESVGSRLINTHEKRKVASI